MSDRLHNQDYRNELADALDQLTSKDRINSSLLRLAAKALRSPIASETKRKLTAHAQVGGTIFRAGVDERLVIERAQSEYVYQNTPGKTAERLERVQKFIKDLKEPQ